MDIPTKSEVIEMFFQDIGRLIKYICLYIRYLSIKFYN